MALKLHKETYDTFVSKFKNKKTTDDCYTPAEDGSPRTDANATAIMILPTKLLIF